MKRCYGVVTNEPNYPYYYIKADNYKIAENYVERLTGASWVCAIEIAEWKLIVELPKHNITMIEI